MMTLEFKYPDRFLIVQQKRDQIKKSKKNFLIQQRPISVEKLNFQNGSSLNLFNIIGN